MDPMNLSRRIKSVNCGENSRTAEQPNSRDAQGSPSSRGKQKARHFKNAGLLLPERVLRLIFSSLFIPQD